MDIPVLTDQQNVTFINPVWTPVAVEKTYQVRWTLRTDYLMMVKSCLGVFITIFHKNGYYKSNLLKISPIFPIFRGTFKKPSPSGSPKPFAT